MTDPEASAPAPSERTEQQILQDAREKHGITGTTEAELLKLIRYARHIGYNDGWCDHRDGR